MEIGEFDLDLRWSYAVGAAVVVVSLVVSAVSYPSLPSEMVVHWDASGTPDGGMSKPLAVLLLPALSAVVLVVLAALPRIDPLGENIEEFRKEYDGLVVVMSGFLGYVHLLVVLLNTGYDFEIIRALSPAVAALYYYVGVVIESAERNWFVGIRTPWTLSDERVWRETHDRAGTLLKLSSVVALGGLVFPDRATLFLVAPVALVAAYATLFSYLMYRRGG
ncbi:MAG: DUF1648 domain-containing protein [Halobacteria archaeon]|nr:DUF1648 domain-containing protein [Halobacteria archaeon]